MRKTRVRRCITSWSPARGLFSLPLPSPAPSPRSAGRRSTDICQPITRYGWRGLICTCTTCSSRTAAPISARLWTRGERTITLPVCLWKVRSQPSPPERNTSQCREYLSKPSLRGKLTSPLFLSLHFLRFFSLFLDPTPTPMPQVSPCVIYYSAAL